MPRFPLTVKIYNKDLYQWDLMPVDTKTLYNATEFARLKATYENHPNIYLEYEGEEEESKPDPSQIINVGSNSGIIGHGSTFQDFDFRPDRYPSQIPTQEAVTTPANKEGVKNGTAEIVRNTIITIISGLIIAYIVYKLGWNK